MGPAARSIITGETQHVPEQKALLTGPTLLCGRCVYIPTGRNGLHNAVDHHATHEARTRGIGTTQFVLVATHAVSYYHGVRSGKQDCLPRGHWQLARAPASYSPAGPRSKTQRRVTPNGSPLPFRKHHVSYLTLAARRGKEITMHLLVRRNHNACILSNLNANMHFDICG